MADKKKEVVLKITFDSKEAEKRQAEIISLLASQNKGYKELQASVNKAGKATAEEAQQLVAYRSNIAALNAEQRSLTKNIGLHNIQMEHSQDATIAMRARLSEATQELIKHSKAEIDASASLSALRDEAKGLSDQLKGNESSWGDNRRNVGNYANSIAGLELKLKDLNETLRHLDPNTEAFEETKKAADDTTVQLGILSGKFDEFGNREPKNPQKQQLDAVADATAGAISAFEIYNLTMGDAEEQSAAQARALQGIAVAQNLRNLQIGIANAGEAAGVIITKASSLAIGAKTKAVGLATVATRVWNAVMSMNPIGAIVTAVIAAVAAIAFLTNKFNLAAKAGEFFNTHFSGVVKWLQKTGEALGLVDSATEKALATMEKRKDAAAEEIRVLEASEGKEREIYEKRRKLMFDEIRLLNKLHKEKGELSADQVSQRRTLINDMKILDIEEKKRIEKDREEADKAAKDKHKKEVEAAKKAIAVARERTKELLEISKGYIELELSKAVEGSDKQLELRKKLIKKQLEIDNAGDNISRERKILNQKTADQEILKLTQDHAQKQLEVQKKRVDDFISLTEKEYSEAQSATEEYFKKKRTAAANDFANGIATQAQYNERLLEIEGELLNQQIQVAKDYSQSTTDLEQQAADRRIAIRQSEADKKKAIQEAEFATAQAMAGAFTELANLVAGQGEELSDFQKAAALFQIGIDTASSLSALTLTSAKVSGAVASASGPFGVISGPLAYAAYYGTGLTTILSAIGKAKQLLSAESPTAPQFYDGGFTTKGNPREQATNLGRKAYTYHKSEYVAPHDVLQDPAGAYLVSQLEGIRLRKRGYADGGFAPAYNYNTLPQVPVPYDHFAAAARYSINGGAGTNIDYDKLADAMAKRPSVVAVADINRVNNKVEVKRTKTDI